MIIKYSDFIDLKYKPSEKDLICTFRLRPAGGLTMKEAGARVASESSVGTWSALDVPERIVEMRARCFSIKGDIVKIAYHPVLFEKGSIPQLLSSIAGNVFGMKAVRALRLENIQFPKALAKSFSGPAIGLKDIRKKLKISRRPLVGTIVKPKIGLHSKTHALRAYESWTGGLDLVKCDENLTNQSFNKFDANVRETLKLKFRAEKETGEKKIYVPNVTAETKEMIRRAKLVRDLGGSCIMIDILTAGWSALQTMRNEFPDMIIHAHRAGHAMFTRGPFGMSMLVVAKLARLAGVSQIHTGTANVGKMKSRNNETQVVNTFLKSGWFNKKPVFPIASGGLDACLVPKLVKKLGTDIIIQAGGGVHALGTRTGAASMRQAVDAVMNGIPLNEYAKTHSELRKAIEKWGLKS